MINAIPMTELWRGGILESQHLGHAVICEANGDIFKAWGNPDQVIFPRSSCKMLQAMPLVESGAADALDLTPAQLALACASHQGAPIHSETVTEWLDTLELGEPDLRCGTNPPYDTGAKHALIRADQAPCQIHHECSGKHVGFLTVNRHIGGHAEYTDVDHPLQQSVKTTFEELTGQDSPGHGVDGCSAPNFATTVHGLARAMGFMAAAHEGSDLRSRSATRLVDAMRMFPEMVAGETRSCTELMRAMDNKVAIKIGADGVYVAIIPEQKRGVALKIADGASRGAECAMAAILVSLGVLDANHPATLKRMNAPQINPRGKTAAWIKPAPGFV